MPLLLQHASTSKSWALSGDAAEDISPQPLTYKVEIFTGDVRGAGTHVSVSPLIDVRYSKAVLTQHVMCIGHYIMLERLQVLSAHWTLLAGTCCHTINWF